MKRLFLALAVMLTLATNAQAKQLIVVNHTSCEWFIQPYMEDQTPPLPPPFPVAKGTSYANLVGPSTSFYPAASATWTYISGGKATYVPSTWIWSHVELWPAPCLPHPSPGTMVSGTDAGRSSAATSTYSSSVDVTTCCGDPNTITWTDLGNGDVQIDIW